MCIFACRRGGEHIYIYSIMVIVYDIEYIEVSYMDPTGI